MAEQRGKRGGEGQNGESRGKPASMLGFDIKKLYPTGQTLYLFSVEAMAFGGKGIGFFFLKSAAEGKGQFDRDIFPYTFWG
ncbi:MAG: hypothetical protein ACLR6J_00925 [Parabacteroides merdae]